MGEMKELSALRLDAAGEATIGLRRAHNDDAVLVRADLDLYAVVDGAGAGGSLASMVALTSLAAHYEETADSTRILPDIDPFGFHTEARRLGAAIHRANRDILTVKERERHRGPMGATLAAMAVCRQTGLVHIAHVGDSRCYRLRGGWLELLTEDHLLIHDVVAMHPDVLESDLAKVPSDVVTRSLGSDETLRVSARSHGAAPGDRYLLCSDGLSDALGDETIAVTLMQASKPASVCAHSLIMRAVEAQTGDNVAAVVVVCSDDASRARRALRRATRHAATVGTGEQAPYSLPWNGKTLPLGSKT